MVKKMFSREKGVKQPHLLFITYLGALEPLIQSQGIPYLRGLTEKGIKVSLLSFEKREYRRQKQEIARLDEELAPVNLYLSENSAHSCNFNTKPVV